MNIENLYISKDFYETAFLLKNHKLIKIDINETGKTIYLLESLTNDILNHDIEIFKNNEILQKFIKNGIYPLRDILYKNRKNNNKINKEKDIIK